ncbi:hypothetical protein ZHAS_00004687 [Anopheles sinensis]|uniref:Uncharacterized protein n=1 Tax=Anopheles sinensis TaxID=74873 RepID=A0A084VHE5_ANOSI|nr:hypothetical protein ZHAS_00004687 [Anopheles sinensis]
MDRFHLAGHDELRATWALEFSSTSTITDFDIDDGTEVESNVKSVKQRYPWKDESKDHQQVARQGKAKVEASAKINKEHLKPVWEESRTAVSNMPVPSLLSKDSEGDQ